MRAKTTLLRQKQQQHLAGQ